MAESYRTSPLPLTQEQRKFTFGPGGMRCSVDDGDMTDAEWQELEQERDIAIQEEMEKMREEVRQLTAQ